MHERNSDSVVITINGKTSKMKPEEFSDAFGEYLSGLHGWDDYEIGAAAGSFDNFLQSYGEPYQNPEGNYCTHHPDDPTHGPICSEKP